MSYDICLQFQLLKVKRVDEAMEYVKCAAMSFERAGLQYDIGIDTKILFVSEF